MDASIWLVNLIVLAAVLLSDLGHREVSTLRLVRPAVVAAVIVPLYVKHPQTGGAGLWVEVAGVVVGLALGLVAARLMWFEHECGSGKVFSWAGYAYAGLWTGVIGARLTFSYGAQHWFTDQLGRWMAHYRVSVDGVTDALILMAIAMLLGRTGSMAVRRARFGRVGFESPRDAVSG